MAERDYSHRSVVDKLGIKPGHVVRFEESAWVLASELRAQVLDRAGADTWAQDAPADVVLATVRPGTDVTRVLREWRERLHPAGGVWLLTRKRGHADYVDQNLLIDRGFDAGLVDNKVCSVSTDVSAMRFVIRRGDRGQPLGAPKP